MVFTSREKKMFAFGKIKWKFFTGGTKRLTTKQYFFLQRLPCMKLLAYLSWSRSRISKVLIAGYSGEKKIDKFAN